MGDYVVRVESFFYSLVNANDLTRAQCAYVYHSVASSFSPLSCLLDIILKLSGIRDWNTIYHIRPYARNPVWICTRLLLCRVYILVATRLKIAYQKLRFPRTSLGVVRSNLRLRFLILVYVACIYCVYYNQEPEAAVGPDDTQTRSRKPQLWVRNFQKLPDLERLSGRD